MISNGVNAIMPNTTHIDSDINSDHTNRRHWKGISLAVAISILAMGATAIIHAL